MLVQVNEGFVPSCTYACTSYNGFFDILVATYVNVIGFSVIGSSVIGSSVIGSSVIGYRFFCHRFFCHRLLFCIFSCRCMSCQTMATIKEPFWLLPTSWEIQSRSTDRQHSATWGTSKTLVPGTARSDQLSK